MTPPLISASRIIAIFLSEWFYALNLLMKVDMPLNKEAKLICSICHEIFTKIKWSTSVKKYIL